MSIVEEAFAGRRVVMAFPQAIVDDWVAVCEVLLQEGLGAWLLPPSWWGIAADMRALYGHRAVMGACGVVDAAGVHAARDAGFAVVASPVHHADLLVGGEGPLVLTGALTPTEIAAVVREGRDTVLVAPVDAVGGTYARSLPSLFAETALIPWGRLESYQAQMWLDAGAAAVIVADVVVRPAGDSEGNALEEVSRRAASFRAMTGA